MFVTLQCLSFDLTKRRVTCAGAGHHQLVVLSPDQPPRLAFPSSGRPAGLMTSNPIESESMPLVEGQTFVLFSDGVSEALDPEGEFFGEDALLAALETASTATAADTCTSVMVAVRAFARGADQSDDITVVAARYA